jgi:hypothetical protein
MVAFARVGCALVLREMTNGNFDVVGEAYIHGLMHGHIRDIRGFENLDVATRRINLQ